MSDQLNVTPTRPYLARAIYEWICDNQLTPYLLVDATQQHTDVPQQFVKDGQIVLNLAPHAIHQFHMDNDAISFSARFGGVAKDIYVPIRAVLGLYARENGDIQETIETPIEDKKQEAEPNKKKPSLRILD